MGKHSVLYGTFKGQKSNVDKINKLKNITLYLKLNVDKAKENLKLENNATCMTGFWIKDLEICPYHELFYKLEQNWLSKD